METRMESFHMDVAWGRRPGVGTRRRRRNVRSGRCVSLRRELGTDHGTIKRVAEQLGIGTESLRSWMRQAEIDAGVTRSEQ